MLYLVLRKNAFNEVFQKYVWKLWKLRNILQVCNAITLNTFFTKHDVGPFIRYEQYSYIAEY